MTPRLACGRGVPVWRPKKVFMRNLYCVGDSKMLEIPELLGNCQGELQTGHGTISRARTVLKSTKLKGAEDLKISLTSGMEIQNLESALLVFSVALVQYFSLFPCPPFRTCGIWSVPLYIKIMTVCFSI